MNCSGCGTQVSAGRRNCPNCGRTVRSWLSAGAKPEPKAPKLASLSDPDQSGQDVELELDEPAPPKGGKTQPTQPRVEAAPARSSVSPDPVNVRGVLAEDPGLLEDGLTIFEEKGAKKGVGYETDVGRIDLLARDRKGALVVVMVIKGDSSTDVVGSMLQRIGWVRKHLAGDLDVRGIVVMDRVSDELSYTAAAVSDKVAFRTYRMSLVFDDVAF